MFAATGTKDSSVPAGVVGTHFQNPKPKGKKMAENESSEQVVEETFEIACAGLRADIQGDAVRVFNLKTQKRFNEAEGYVGQHEEMIANIMLAYRHLEDARMRVGKILQAAGDGVSILDK